MTKQSIKHWAKKEQEQAAEKYREPIYIKAETKAEDTITLSSALVLKVFMEYVLGQLGPLHQGTYPEVQSSWEDFGDGPIVTALDSCKRCNNQFAEYILENTGPAHDGLYCAGCLQLTVSEACSK